MLSSSAKRSYNNTFHPPTGRAWKHLDEGSALEKVPEPLKKLVHLRNMGSEIGASNVKAAVEVQYHTALANYLQEPVGDAAYDKAQSLVVLYRLSQSENEANDILTAYERIVAEYMIVLLPPSDGTDNIATV